MEIIFADQFHYDKNKISETNFHILLINKITLYI
jgi:hypothetical protein